MMEGTQLAIVVFLFVIALSATSIARSLALMEAHWRYIAEVLKPMVQYGLLSSKTVDVRIQDVARHVLRTKKPEQENTEGRQ